MEEITIRLFAAAAEAAGASELRIPTPPTWGAAMDYLVAEFGAPMDKVLRASACICCGERLSAESALSDDAVVEVLPPFAGG
ncbi:MAG: MoaD/ThiS family protein [Actinomycetaceae bacterium]|nr:MoaD/ThiS family protein [Actinomycetaceae bacterium]